MFKHRIDYIERVKINFGKCFHINSQNPMILLLPQIILLDIEDKEFNVQNLSTRSLQ